MAAAAPRLVTQVSVPAVAPRRLEGIPSFASCDAYVGRRPGFAFKLGDRGLGYARPSGNLLL